MACAFAHILPRVEDGAWEVGWDGERGYSGLVVSERLSSILVRTPLSNVHASHFLGQTE